ncbi:hypothetical protein [Mucilaginibacter sp. 22184]|uniref:hypothetical protein n=1 Tax=Mucilaginibacter sp. 22184 TaxID=3453887 RepID=UPI003F866456
MKKFIGFCLALATGISHIYAQSIEKKLQVSLGTGYQQQNFHWSIAGNLNGQNPNIYSELKWQHLGGQNIAANVLWNVRKRFSLYASYSRQSISSGSVTDTDYGADNRTNPTYHETFNGDKGNTSLWNTGAGFILINNERFSLIPYVGYTMSKQSLHLLDRTGNFPDLNSTYQPNWKGAFLKVTSSVRIIKNLKFAADVIYNQVNYNSKANWNLIQTFQHPVSYRHHASGYGIDVGGQFVYTLYRNLSVHAGAGYFNWQTGTGTDELYLNNGQVDKTQLNEVVNSGFRVEGGIGLAF